MFGELRLDIVQTGCLTIIQRSNTVVEFGYGESSSESWVIWVPLSVSSTFGCFFGTRPLSSSCGATWFAVVLYCCFDVHGSLHYLRIVDHGFLLLRVMSVD